MRPCDGLHLAEKVVEVLAVRAVAAAERGVGRIGRALEPRGLEELRRLALEVEPGRSEIRGEARRTQRSVELVRCHQLDRERPQLVDRLLQAAVALLGAA